MLVPERAGERAGRLADGTLRAQGDPEIGSPDADPDQALQRAETALDALAP